MMSPIKYTLEQLNGVENNDFATTKPLALSAGAVEYTDCFSAEE